MGLEDVYYTLREVHKGICEVHTRVKALARQVIRVKFFFPTLRMDVEHFVNKYKKY